MLMLETLARKVVARWSEGDLAEAVRELDAHLKAIAQDRGTYAAEIATARQEADDDLEIDDEPLLSASDEGVWVGAWVWVQSEEDEEEATIREIERERDERRANHIDGYDRDDLGESPDY